MLVLGAGCSPIQKIEPIEYQAPEVSVPEVAPAAPQVVSAPVQADPFDLTKKVPGTKIFESKKLGIKFTYAPDLLNPGTIPEKIKVREEGNKMYLFFGPESNMKLNSFSAQTIEMFTKDPNMTLEEAIKEKFLKGKEKDCAVQVSDTYSNDIQNPYPQMNWPDVEFADIYSPLVPKDASLDDPNWGKNEECAPGYAITNAIRFFVMNKNVPDRFYFVSVGQESIASDGTPPTKEGVTNNWFHSLRIIK